MEPMIIFILCEGDDPPLMRLINWVEHVKPERLPHESFELVSMTPQFTRRERLTEVGRPIGWINFFAILLKAR